MADENLWGQLSNSNDPLGDIIALGQNALASGKVTPTQAKKHYKDLHPVLQALGVKPNPLAMNQALPTQLKSPITAQDAQAIMDQKRAAQQPQENVMTSDSAVYSAIEPTSSEPADIPQIPDVSPVGKESGLKNVISAENLNRDETNQGSGDKTSLTTLLTMGAPQFNQAYGNAAETASIQQQAQGVKDLNEMLAMQAKAPTDYFSGPIAGLLQSEFGRNPAAMLAGRGITPEEQSKNLMAGLEKLQSAKQNISKDLLNSVSQQKAGTLTEMLYNNAMQKALDQSKGSILKSASDPNQRPNNTPVLNYDRFNNQVNKNLTKDTELAGKLSTLTQELQAGNPIDDARINIIRATMDAGGRPNIAEVKTEAGSKALLAKAQNAYDFLKSGNMSDYNRQKMIESLQTMSEYRQAVRSAEAKRLANMGKHYGLSDAEINDTIPESFINRYPSPSGTGGAQVRTYDGTTPLPKNPTPEQKAIRQNWLERKKKGEP